MNPVHEEPEQFLDHGPFGPSSNREVICIHCNDIYNEQELVFENRFEIIDPRTDTPLMLWWCRNKTCNGAGMRYDIYPTDDQFVSYSVWCARWKAQHGFHPAEMISPIEDLAVFFAPRKTLTVKHQLKKRRHKQFATLKEGKL